MSMEQERTDVTHMWIKACPYCHATRDDGMHLVYLFDCECEMPYVCYSCHRDEHGLPALAVEHEYRKRTQC
jgi:hypothetical protein